MMAAGTGNFGAVQWFRLATSVSPTVGQLLNDLYMRVQESVLPVLAAAAKYRSTIASDGWSNVRRRPTLNFMEVTGGRAAR